MKRHSQIPASTLYVGLLLLALTNCSISMAGVEGDVNGDGEVNMLDLAVLSDHWLDRIGATYYVDSDFGSDENDGRDPNRPWRTLEKVMTQGAAGMLKWEDRVLLRRGRLWRESLVMPASGIDVSPILFGAYGEGSAPIISGADRLTQWQYIPKQLGLDDFETGGRESFWAQIEGIVDQYSQFGIPGPDQGGDRGIRLESGAGDGVQVVSSKEYWVEFDFRVGELTNKRQYFLDFADPNGLDLLQCMVSDESPPRIRIYEPLHLNAYHGNTSLIRGQWYRVKVRVNTGEQNGEGVVQIWIDDQLELSLSSRQFQNHLIGWIWMGHTMPSGTDQMTYYDNFRYSFAEFGPGTYYRAELPSMTSPSAPSQLYEDNVRLGSAEPNLLGVDAPGDWYLDYVEKYVYMISSAGKNPAQNEVEISVRNFCIDFNSQNYVTVEGLSLKRSKLQAVNCVSWSLEQGSVIRNLRIDETGYGGIAIGVYVDNVLVENCEISRCEHSGIFLNNSNLQSGLVPDHVTIRYNYIHDVKRQGVAVERVKKAKIYYNVISDVNTDIGVPGARAIGLQIDSVTGLLEVYNNTVFDCKDWAITIQKHSGQVICKNNLFIASGDEGCLGLASGVYPILDYNGYYGQGEIIIGWGDNSYSLAEFAAFQSGGLFEQNGLAGDPGFQDAQNGQFQISRQTSYYQGGTPIGISQDIVNEFVSEESPTLGAYEKPWD